MTRYDAWLMSGFNGPHDDRPEEGTGCEKCEGRGCWRCEEGPEPDEGGE